jgi:hypothetical protein
VIGGAVGFLIALFGVVIAVIQGCLVEFLIGWVVLYVLVVVGCCVKWRKK